MKKALLYFLILTALTVHSFAQEIQLYGLIFDKVTNEPISSALIEILDQTTGKKYITQSTSSGTWSSTLTDITDITKIPAKFSLEQNYPNPFNPSTKIGFNINKTGNVVLRVYTILGQELDRKSFDLSPGYYSIDWYSKGSTSVLFYSIEMDGLKLTKKMMQIEGGTGGLGNLNRIGDTKTLSNDVIKINKKSAHDLKIVVTRLGYLPDSTTFSANGSTNVNFILESVHHNAFFIDLHNDLLENTYGSGYNWGIEHSYTQNNIQSDIPRLLKGGIDAEMFVVWLDPRIPGKTKFFADAIQMINEFNNQMTLNSTLIAQAKNEAEIMQIRSQNKIAAILAVEGGYTIDDDIEKLKSLYSIGVRYMTITWNSNTNWAVAAKDTKSKTQGLTEFGKQVIQTMDSLGMIIDISHTGIKTIEDILAITKNPIIASHCNAYSLFPHYRNLTDDQIKAIAKGGGVIGINFYPSFISTNKIILDSVIKHIDYIKNLVGIDYIAIGADYDGMGSPLPTDLYDVTQFPRVTMALLQKGYSISDVKKILGENFLRVFRKVCK